MSLQPEDLQSPTKTTSLPSLDDIKDPDEKVRVWARIVRIYNECEGGIEKSVPRITGLASQGLQSDDKW